MCDHYAEYYWPYKEHDWRVAAFDDPEGEPDDFVAVADEPTPREGLHFPPSDEFGYGS